MAQCIFCDPGTGRAFLQNALAYALWDAYPVVEFHALVIPRRHAVDWFDLTREEVLACDALVREARALILERDPAIEGFNIGTNAGRAAGQTVFHCHLHLIPRRPGDVADARGGVRHVIPGKGIYG